MRRHSQRMRIIVAILSALILISMVLTGVVATVGASPAYVSEVGDTTTTQPEDRRVFGKSLPQPNEGMEPQQEGDPGTWLQSSLFFIVCGAVGIMALGVASRSHKLRQRRKETGHDPVELARQRGEGVRAPSPLDKR